METMELEAPVLEVLDVVEEVKPELRTFKLKVSPRDLLHGYSKCNNCPINHALRRAYPGNITPYVKVQRAEVGKNGLYQTVQWSLEDDKKVRERAGSFLNIFRNGITITVAEN